MDNTSNDCEMSKRLEPEEYDGTDDPFSPSRNKGDNGANNITLWQFLLELLVSEQFSHIICWTNNEGEFKLLNAEEVARLWGLRKNKNNMNYDKLSRALRYYYDKNIIKKVLGQKFVYRFVSFPEFAKTDGKVSYQNIRIEPMAPPKVNGASLSPYGPAQQTSVPSTNVPSPSDAFNGTTAVTSSPSHSQHRSSHNPTPPPAHIGSYPTLSPLVHAYQAAFTQMAAAASLGGYLSALTRRPDAELTPTHVSSSPVVGAWTTPEVPSAPQIRCSSTTNSEDSQSDDICSPLHLVSEEASRRRREEEAEERRREEIGKRSWHTTPGKSSPRSRSPFLSPMRSRSPLSSPPPPGSPLTPPPVKETKPSVTPARTCSQQSESSLSSSKVSVVSRSRSGPKPKPSPLSIEAITGGPPIVSPRQFSASSLNTPVVSLPSPPYSGVGTKSPYYPPPLHLWSSLSPLASMSPHYGSPRGHRHFTFPVLPSQYPPIPPHILSPLLPTTTFDFSTLSSPADKSTTVPVLQ